MFYIYYLLFFFVVNLFLLFGKMEIGNISPDEALGPDREQGPSAAATAASSGEAAPGTPGPCPGMSSSAKPQALKVPFFDGNKAENYKSWKGYVELWMTGSSNIPLNQMALRIVLEGIAPGSKAAKELSNMVKGDFMKDNAVELIFEKLDEVFLPVKFFQAFQATRDFHDLKRKSTVTVADHITEWSQKLNELENHNYTEQSVKGLQLLHSCNLPSQERQNILNSVPKPITVSGMKDALRMNYSHVKITDDSLSTLDTDIFVDTNKDTQKGAGSLYTQWRGSYRGSFRGRSRGFRGNNNFFSRKQPYSKSNEGNKRHFRCYNCDLSGHFIAQCPKLINKAGVKETLLTRAENDRYNFNTDEFILTGNSVTDTQVVHLNNSFPNNLVSNDGKQVTATEGGFNIDFESDEFFLESYDNIDGTLMPIDLFIGCAGAQNDDALQKLVSEAKGYAVLDSGCAMTVCGAKWLNEYIENLDSEFKRLVVRQNSSQRFAFGGGHTVKATMRVDLPCWMGGKKGKVITDVVPCNIPLLLSRYTMEQAKFILDFGKRTVTWKDQQIKLKLSTTGHYCLPIHL